MDPRSLYLLGMLGLPALAVLNALWFQTELKNFLSSTPSTLLPSENPMTSPSVDPLRLFAPAIAEWFEGRSIETPTRPGFSI